MWSDSEDHQLYTLWSQGTRLNELAKLFGKEEEDCSFRLSQLNSQQNAKNEMAEELLVNLHVLCPTHNIGRVIGKNGSTINSIQTSTSAQVNITRRTGYAIFTASAQENLQVTSPSVAAALKLFPLCCTPDGNGAHFVSLMIDQTQITDELLADLGTTASVNLIKQDNQECVWIRGEKNDVCSAFTHIVKRMRRSVFIKFRRLRLMEWHKMDKRRFLHVVYRVGDLDSTIKFYTHCFGMKLLRKIDLPEENYSNAILGFGPETSTFTVELIHNHDVVSYEVGTGFGSIAISTENVSKMVEIVRARGGNVTGEAGPVKGGGRIIAFVKDPNGYLFKLIESGPVPESLCQVMLRVVDMERSIKFYKEVLGMTVFNRVSRPDYGYNVSMLGYPQDGRKFILELTYNVGVTEYNHGNGYLKIAVGSDDIYKSFEVVKELGGKIKREPYLVSGAKMVSFFDPDGWEIVLVDNADHKLELKNTEDF